MRVIWYRYASPRPAEPLRSDIVENSRDCTPPAPAHASVAVIHVGPALVEAVCLPAEMRRAPKGAIWEPVSMDAWQVPVSSDGMRIALRW